eukprot:4922083-Pleurochrysis_carterae.AAC.1
MADRGATIRHAEGLRAADQSPRHARIGALSRTHLQAGLDVLHDARRAPGQNLRQASRRERAAVA